MKIGILGGSFNPPHNGHLYLGQQFHDILGLDRVLVIPAGTPPHKANAALAADADRLKMCEMLFCAPYFTVSDMELTRSGKSYTVDTVSQLRALYPDDELYLLVGADMLLYFDKWYRWRDILAQCTLCAFARDSLHAARELRDYVDIVLCDERVVILSVPPLPVSSTRIRRNIETGESLDGLLPEDLICYIQKKGLYCEK